MCIYIYMPIFTNTHEHVYVCIHLLIYIYIYIYMYLYVCICIFIPNDHPLPSTTLRAHAALGFSAKPILPTVKTILV
jgi:hypothetical protein